MASGLSPAQRQREQDPQGKDNGGRWAPGLTPVSLFLVLGLFWIATQAGLVLVLGLLAIVLGTVLEGPVRRLEERHFPRAAAIATVYVALIGIIVLLVFLIVPVFRDQSDEFQEQIPAQMRELEEDWSQSSNGILSGPGRELLRTGLQFFEQPAGTVTVSGEAAERAIPIIASVGSVLVSIVTMLVITFYYLLEKKLIRRVAIDQLSPNFQPRVDRLWTEVESKVGSWIRGQLLLCLIIGIMATTSYGIIGLSFWPLLGLWAGITEIIPIVGPWLGGIPAVIVALTMGWETALIVLLIIVVIQQMENWFLVPRVMRGAVGLTPLTVFVAIIAGTELIGVVGAILAIPIAATVQVIVTDYLDQRRLRDSSDGEPISGWRWMLNRGIGRDQSTANESLPEDDAPVTGNEQVVSDQMYAGNGDVVASARPTIEGDVSAGHDRDDETPPRSPWRSRREGTASSPQWRGMTPARKPAETTRAPGPVDDKATGAGPDGDDAGDRKETTADDEQ